MLGHASVPPGTSASAGGAQGRCERLQSDLHPGWPWRPQRSHHTRPRMPTALPRCGRHLQPQTQPWQGAARAGLWPPATWPSDPSLPAPAQSRGSGWRHPTLSRSVVWVPGKATPLAGWPPGGLARTRPRAFPPQGSEPKTGAHLRADWEAQAPLVGDNEGDDGLENSGEERVDSEDEGAELLRKRRRDLKT